MGQVDFIWASAVLHVLSKVDCEKFLGNVELLLKPKGSTYGWTVGSLEPKEWADTPDGKQKRFLHSPVSATQRPMTLCAGLHHLAFTACGGSVRSPAAL